MIFKKFLFKLFSKSLWSLRRSLKVLITSALSSQKERGTAMDNRDDIPYWETEKYKNHIRDYRADMKKLAAGFSAPEGERILRALEVAIEAHKTQKRKSGEPFVMHPVASAKILNELGLDADSITAGLLHDCIEDTNLTKADIAGAFGHDVALLVDGVTKLGQIEYSSREEEQMEDLRRMFIAMAKDIRVIIIKLADRLHNIRTIQYQKPVKQSEICLETMEIYAPLAHRLGIHGIKEELEDRSLRILDPIGYEEIQGFLAGKEESFAQFLQVTQGRIEDKLHQAGINAEVKTRLKSVYSIYRKLYGQNLTFDEIYDLCACRIIVHSILDCYNVFGVIHDLYRPVPGRFKDYISTPKPNGYQSLHTVVIGGEGIPFEVQIRTADMDKSAEYGIAAHWKYKGGLKGQQSEDAFAWVRQLLETQQDSDAEDFISNIKVDLFADEVYVFTPKGDVISLPAGATPIDFAYAIHSAVGNRMTGAKVNGRIVPIDYALKSGEIVDIATAKNSSGPKRDWMQIVRTNSARSKIRQWFKKERKEENVEHGKSSLDRELRVNLIYDSFMQADFLAFILKQLGFQNLEELYSSIGYGGVMVSKVVGRAREELNKRQKAKEQLEVKPIPPKRKAIADTGVIVEGIDNCLVKFAKCCTPVPGDDIIGFVTRGHGVSVHRVDCANVKSSLSRSQEDYNRWITTEWDLSEKHKYLTAVRVTAKNRPGVLSDLVNVLGNMKINVNELSVRDDHDGQNIYYLTITVFDKGQLDLVMQRLRRAGGVSDVSRAVETGQK